MSNTDIVKEMHYCNLHQVAATLALAEATLLAQGAASDKEDARQQVLESLEFYETRGRETFGRV